MGILEPITHKEEVKQLLNDAQTIYDNAANELERQKKRTTKSLKKLGQIKVRSWSEGMDSFVTSFGAFKNVDMHRIDAANMKFIGYDEEPKKMIMNIENASLNAKEIVKAGVASVGTGALVGVAAYGGAMMFGKASTGTAIAALHGVAKTNATLAWFGGGAKAAGGLGMAGGKLMLTGIVVAPILGVAVAIAGAKGRERLAEAKQVHEQAENAAEQMNIITTGMKGVEKLSDNYAGFIKRFHREFKPFLIELDRIKDLHALDDSGKVDFDDLSMVEQKTLHLAWLMAQIYYHVLSTPILTSKGELSEKAKNTLTASAKDLWQLRKDTFLMTDEDRTVGNLLWKTTATKMLFANFVIIGLLVAVGVMLVGSNILKGILIMACSLVACPIFFIIKEIPASRLAVWRLVRLIIAMVLMIIIAILL